MPGDTGRRPFIASRSEMGSKPGGTESELCEEQKTKHTITNPQKATQASDSPFTKNYNRTTGGNDCEMKSSLGSYGVFIVVHGLGQYWAEGDWGKGSRLLPHGSNLQQGSERWETQDKLNTYACDNSTDVFNNRSS